MFREAFAVPRPIAASCAAGPDQHVAMADPVSRQ